MSNKEAYETKLAEITAISDDQVKTPTSIPVEAYVQEADNIYIWCQDDREALTARGLNWELVEDIPLRAGALGRAESLWFKERFTREEAEKEWKEKSPLTYKLRDDLIQDLRFAYRKDDDLTGKVRAIAEGASHADMLQDLNNLVAIGEGNPEPLAAINFDMSLLVQADQIADEMSTLLAAATGERIEFKQSKKIRDKAYTYLKEIVDEVYAYGNYVFRYNDERLKGYRSIYLRRLRSKQTSEPEPAVSEAPVTPPVQVVS